MRSPSIDVSLLTTAHDVADARLHRLVAVLVAAGLTVDVDGIGTATGGPPGVSVRGRPRRSLLHRAVRAVVMPWTARGRVLLVIDPELVLPALVRRGVARRSKPGAAGRVVVADVHEDYAKVVLDRAWATGVRLVVARVLVAGSIAASRRADATVVADEHLPPHRPRARLVVQNLPLEEMLPADTPPERRPRALYVGDVRRSRGLYTMLALLEACPEWSLDVVGPVAQADRSWLSHWRETSSARDRVRFHGRRPPRDAWRLARGAWVGLCLLEPTPAFVPALPSKLLEYLACGLTVVTSSLPRATALVAESGAGAVADDVAGGAAALRALAAAPDTLTAHRAAARSWARKHLFDSDHYREFADLMVGLARVEHR